MSKLAKKPFSIPEGVTVGKDNNRLILKGEKGELVLTIPPGIEVAKKENAVAVSGKESRIVGLFTSLVKNVITGINQGFRKELELVGVGYKAEVAGDILRLALGFSHPVEYKIPEGVKITMVENTKVVVEGVDKQLVGQVAAEIRKLRPPEPYKGKGIRYVGEVVRRKSGKAMKVTVGGA